MTTTEQIAGEVYAEVMAPLLTPSDAARRILGVRAVRQAAAEWGNGVEVMEQTSETA